VIAWTGGWPIAIGVVIAAVTCMRSRELHPRRPDRLAIAGLFAFALALRLGFGLWAPLHINGQGPLWIGAAAVRPAMLAGYGPGYAEVFSAITALARHAPDVAIFAANATASALVPVLAFVLGRIAGLERDRALFGAGILAIDPVAVRFSATESYFVPIVVLTLAASTAIAAAVRVSARSRTAAAAFIVTAGLFAVQAARVHPVAWIPIAMCPLAALLGGPAPSRAGSSDPAPGVRVASRLVWLVVALLVLAITVAVTSAGSLVASGGDATRYAGTISHRIGRPAFVMLVGLAVAVLRVRHWTVVLLGALALALDLLLRPVYGQSEAWQACFDRLFLAAPVLAIAAAIPRAWFGARMRFVLVAGVLVVAGRIAWQVRTPTTEQVEYRWLRDELARLDPECRVASVSRAGRRVLYVPWYAMAPEGDRPHAPARWLAVANPVALVESARASRCVVWVHASLCESADGRPVCASIEDAVALVELASLEIEAVPSARDYPYDVPIVRVALSRVAPP